MANMQEVQLRPIADAAKALEGIAIDATADEIATAVTSAISHLTDALQTCEVSDAVAVSLIPGWKAASTALRDQTNDRSTAVASRFLKANGGKSQPIVVNDIDGRQMVCTPNVRVKRSQIQRDELVEAVERAASDPKNRLNPNGTGEMLDYDTAKVILMKKSFRMEPRWTELKKLGIHDDEFCTREQTYSLDIQPGGDLWPTLNS